MRVVAALMLAAAVAARPADVVAGEVLDSGGADGAAEAPLTAAELAVLANEVHVEHCADIQGSDIGMAAAKVQQVAQVWGRLDAALAADGEPYLLYWRGLLSDCLGQPDRALDDLVSFLEVIDELERRESIEEGTLEQMVSDANRRVAKLQRGAASSAGAQRGLQRGPVSLATRRRRAGGTAMLIAGGATAVAGFAINTGLYRQHYVDGVDQGTYEWARDASHAGFAVGVVGAAVGVAGIVVAVAPARGTEKLAVIPGPVTVVSWRF